MTCTTPIVSLEDDGPEPDGTDVQAPSARLPDATEQAGWIEDESPAPARWHGWVFPALCGLALAGWTGLFVAAHIADTGTPDQWLGWITAWSGPVAVLGLVWLAVRQTGQTEAERFSETARQLHKDAAALETRLAAVNAELSIAREFLAAQTRDLDALGRLAVERLSHSAQDLAALILDNSAQVTSIGSVSIAAVENMERLRGHLPVLTNAVKDVANTIGTAGRLADDRVGELTRGMERLESLGATGEARIAALRDTLAEAGARGQDLAAHVGAANDGLAASIARIGTFHASVDSQASAHAALLEQMRLSLATLDAESTELAAKANHELTGALARLQAAAVATGSAIREQGGQAVADIAAQLAEDSITEIERAMRLEAASLAGRLEQAAAHAAGVAREAGSQSMAWSTLLMPALPTPAPAPKPKWTTALPVAPRLSPRPSIPALLISPRRWTATSPIPPGLPT